MTTPPPIVDERGVSREVTFEGLREVEVGEIRLPER